MDTETIGLDDIVATLMSMGFEFQDCQDAITNGKLTIQAAVEWIIAGKPGNVVAPQPTLKLNKKDPHTSNPFVAGTAPTQNPTHASSSANEAQDVEMTDDLVVSRSHMSEKQQQIKVDFEERERQEARRKVTEDKRRKKLEKERILKEIQEDREKQKLVRAKVDVTNQVTEPVKPAPSDSSSSASVSQSDNTATASIQIRLPSGKIFRQTFSASASLNTVWDTVSLEMQSALNAYSGFIQPFPRKEFTKEEMGSTLQSLGLTPSGSLVLKKKDVEQATRLTAAPEPEQHPSVRQALEEINQEHQMAEEEEQENQHQWGRGFRVEGNEVPAENLEEDMDDRQEDEDPFDQMLGFNEHPIFGGGGGRRGQPRAFEGFGNRLVPEGVPADHGRHLNRRAADMAAEAAAQRFAQPRPAAVDEAASESHTELSYSPLGLQAISMNTLARRIIDPRSPLQSMSGLSDNLLQMFLEHLKKEKLLKPKTLYLMPSYLLRLNLDSYPYTTNELLHAARVLVNLQSISLVSCPLITDSGLNALRGMKMLKSLTLQGCTQITDACITVISELPSLQSLNLEDTGISNAGVTQLASGGHCSELLHLDLSRTSITHAVITVLPNFKNLKSLRLKQSKIMSLSGIERITSLENIDISETAVVTDSILCLTRLPKLSFVCLSGTNEIVGDTALSYMQGMHLTYLLLPSRTTTTDLGLSYITGFHLTSLDLTNYTQVEDAGMMHVGCILSLKTLLLTNTRITDEGMLHLKELTNLQTLLVDKTMVSNKGAAIVQNFKLLHELSLAGTSISSDLLRQETLNHCTSLSKLNLSRTIIGDKGLQLLKLPNLTLLNLDSTRVHSYVFDLIKKNCPKIKTVSLANLSTEPEDDV